MLLQKRPVRTIVKIPLHSLYKVYLKGQPSYGTRFNSLHFPIEFPGAFLQDYEDLVGYFKNAEKICSGKQRELDRLLGILKDLELLTEEEQNLNQLEQLDVVRKKVKLASTCQIDELVNRACELHNYQTKAPDLSKLSPIHRELGEHYLSNLNTFIEAEDLYRKYWPADLNNILSDGPASLNSLKNANSKIRKALEDQGFEIRSEGRGLTARHGIFKIMPDWF